MYWCLYAYMSVCPLAYLKNHTSEFLVIFCICYLRSWLIPSLMTVKYVIYLWFCGWRHVSHNGVSGPECVTRWRRQFDVGQHYVWLSLPRGSAGGKVDVSNCGLFANCKLFRVMLSAFLVLYYPVQSMLLWYQFWWTVIVWGCHSSQQSMLLTFT